MNIRSTLFAATIAALTLFGCEPTGSDAVQQDMQERILAEAIVSVGMPAIKNFREKRLVKMLFEMRDQNDLSTYTYLWSEVAGRWVFFCNSIGYGIPYATQFTAPEKASQGSVGGHYLALPQADPNGLFSPTSADWTWIMCKDPKNPDVKPVFVEPRVIVSPFELPAQPAVTKAAIDEDAAMKPAPRPR